MALLSIVESLFSNDRHLIQQFLEFTHLVPPSNAAKESQLNILQTENITRYADINIPRTEDFENRPTRNVPFSDTQSKRDNIMVSLILGFPNLIVTLGVFVTMSYININKILSTDIFV